MNLKHSLEKRAAHIKIKRTMDRSKTYTVKNEVLQDP